MSSFRNAAKSNQKTHRERSQLTSRQHLGLLEKKKDYKRRADDYHKKQATIKTLRRKALDKNPDEFYFKMVRTQMEDGEHQCEDNTPKYTKEQLKLMQSQDIRYVNFKRSIEQKKIERLKACLHLLDADCKRQNQHTVFVDSLKEAKSFDPAKFLNTHPELLNRSANRPLLDQLSSAKVQGSTDDHSLAAIESLMIEKLTKQLYLLQAAAVQRKQLYSQLSKRIEREKQLSIIAQKLETKRSLMDKSVKRKKVAEETVNTAAIYRQAWRRKR